MDIVERLRQDWTCPICHDGIGEVVLEAAAEIARLRAEVERLKAAGRELLDQIKRHPGGCGERPFYQLKRSSQLNNPDRAVIRFRAALATGGKEE